MQEVSHHFNKFLRLFGLNPMPGIHGNQCRLGEQLLDVIAIFVFYIVRACSANKQGWAIVRTFELQVLTDILQAFFNYRKINFPGKPALRFSRKIF